MINPEVLITFYHHGCKFMLAELSMDTRFSNELRTSVSGIYFSAYATGDISMLHPDEEIMNVLAEMIDIALGHTLITIENTLFTQKASIVSLEYGIHYSPNSLIIRGRAIFPRFRYMPLLKTTRRLLARHEWNQGFPVVQQYFL